MSNLLRLAFLAALFLSIAGCQEDLETAPAYIQVEGFEVVTPNLDGTTADITEVWAFQNGIPIGTYRLPARIPVFSVGETELTFQAGVKRNGISRTPDIFEFYTPVERDLELVPGETIDLGVLTIGYRPEVQFGFIESFEPDRDRIFVTPIRGTSELIPTDERSRSGNFSGFLRLTQDEPLIAIASDEGLSGLFDNRPSVWLEVDFLSDSPVAWGVTGFLGPNEVQELDPTSAPRDAWTKIYFDLSEVVAVSRLETLEVFLTAVLPEGDAEAEVYLDNIRLLYF